MYNNPTRRFVYPVLAFVILILASLACGKSSTQELADAASTESSRPASQSSAKTFIPATEGASTNGCLSYCSAANRGVVCSWAANANVCWES